MERVSLIAHETAHMWFGDYVTMRWFDDVWTKEVFANWFAARIVRPLFPSINYTLSDLKDLYASAYKEDRTKGSNAIWRPLDNLQDAGLIYCNIIYDKAPVVMDKLSEMLGEQAFREGLREYLETFKYSNASWDDLVEVLDRRTETDLEDWSEVWIKEPGMPEYVGKVIDGELSVIQKDPSGRGLEWQQSLKHETAENRYWIPNIDGKGYGWFRPDTESYEGECPDFPDCLRSLASDPSRAHELRLMAFRQYFKSPLAQPQLEELYSIWKTQQAYPGLEPGERDFTDLACQLMIAFPERAADIADIQSSRITNPDRRETFEMLCRAASPDPEVRSALFSSFLESAQNRHPESRVLSALALLCHRQRQKEALEYIVPSLDALQEIQKTSDIFFPASWCSVLLKNQQNAAAVGIVDEWMSSHPDINPLLATKILQALER